MLFLICTSQGQTIWRLDFSFNYDSKILSDTNPWAFYA